MLVKIKVGVKSFEELDLKDLNSFFIGFERICNPFAKKKDFGFGIDLNPLIFDQNPFQF